MSPLLASLATWMRNLDIEVRYSKELSALYGIKHIGLLRLDILVWLTDDLVIADFLLSVAPDADRRTAVIDFLTRMNHRVFRVRWLYDSKLNVIACRYTLEVASTFPMTESRFTTAMKRTFIFIAATVPLLLEVIEGRLDPAGSDRLIVAAMTTASRSMPQPLARRTPLQLDFDFQRN